jgi:hypothetical protein
MDSLIPELAAQTAREAELADEWIEAFRPLFRVERVDRDGDEMIEIAFDYLGARSYYEWSDDHEELTRIVADAARSFGYTLKVEREKFGRLDMPRSQD